MQWDSAVIQTYDVAVIICFNSRWNTIKNNENVQNLAVLTNSIDTYYALGYHF